MYKFYIVFILAIGPIVFPVMGPSWAEEAALKSSGIITNPSGAELIDTDLLKDRRMNDLENEYKTALAVLLTNLQNESDAFEQEKIQKKISALKTEREIKSKLLQLQIAQEKGNKVLEFEISRVLESLYESGQALPSFKGPAQESEPGTINSGKSSKKPDDA